MFLLAEKHRAATLGCMASIGEKEDRFDGAGVILWALVCGFLWFCVGLCLYLISY